MLMPTMTMTVLMKMFKTLSTKNVEVATRALPYLARQMSRVAYADIGDADTP